MKINTFGYVVLFLFLTKNVYTQEPFVCQGQYFLSLSAGVSSNSGLFLVEFDAATNSTVFNPISTAIGATMNAIGYRRTDNLIYGVNPSPSQLRLYRIGADGVAFDLGIPQGIDLSGFPYYAGDITPDGNFLILLGQDSSNDGVLAFIDLNDPNYQVTNISLSSSFGGIYDIAFDPFSGDLYGFSTSDAKLVEINTTTGQVTSGFPQQAQVNQVGALFFDVSGSLFGYGRINGDNTLVEIDIETGVMNAVANGPPSGGEDGCSCPYFVELLKSVSTDTALPCTEVVYTFSVTNSSGLTHSNTTLSDIMPEDFTVVEVTSNPFGGTVFIDNNILSITGMNVPPGTDSVQVVVEIGVDALGNYQNQAVLSGLPTSLGESIVSDNPSTTEIRDSTPIFIEPLDITFIAENYEICPGDILPIDASLYGVVYLWEDGSSDPIRLIDTEGDYAVTVTSACDQVIADFTVTTDLNYFYIEEQFSLCDNQFPLIYISDYAGDYLWDDGSIDPIRIFEEPGNYQATVTNNCDITIINYDISTNGYYLDVSPDTIEIELGEYVDIITYYSAGDNGVEFSWNDPLGNTLDCRNCSSTTAQPTSNVTYTLTMSVDNGCTYRDNIVIKVSTERAVYIPNIISPNADGVNDYFYVQSERKNVKVKKMSIFDRWGNLIHEGQNFDINQGSLGWDGSSDNQIIQSGVFVYVIELEFIDGFIQIESGDVTVIR